MHGVNTLNPTSVAQAMMATGSRTSTTGADVTQTTKGVSTHDVSSQLRQNASDPNSNSGSIVTPQNVTTPNENPNDIQSDTEYQNG